MCLTLTLLLCRFGRLGLGAAPDSAPPTTVTALRGLAMSAVACGSGHTLALTADGRVYGWGYNGQGAVAPGCVASDAVLSPIQVRPVRGVRVVNKSPCSRFLEWESHCCPAYRVCALLAPKWRKAYRLPVFRRWYHCALADLGSCLTACTAAAAGAGPQALCGHSRLRLLHGPEHYRGGVLLGRAAVHLWWRHYTYRWQQHHHQHRCCRQS
jgi:hypothetical protein